MNGNDKWKNDLRIIAVQTRGKDEKSKEVAAPVLIVTEDLREEMSFVLQSGHGIPPDRLKSDQETRFEKRRFEEIDRLEERSHH